MMGRLDLKRVVCPLCGGTGRSGKNRKNECAGCRGSGFAAVCLNCGGVYGVECADTSMDQSYCGKDRRP